MWNSRSPLRSRFLLCVFGGFSLAVSACGGSTTKSGVNCEYDGQLYEEGQMIDDGCGGCVCADDGSLICSSIYCPGGAPRSGDGSCEVNGTVYPDGAAIPDDCGGCQCEGGQVYCSLLFCYSDPCALAFDVGECDAYFPVFWHNPETGECEEAVYGGCGGNDNRYTSRAQCEASCLSAEATQKSCVVGEITYPHGASGVPDAGSCNTCSCDDGKLTGCTKAACPIACSGELGMGSECAECDANDTCLAVRTACLPVCDSTEECQDSSTNCIDGLCRTTCEADL